MPLVITTCTNRKRRPVASELHAGGLPRGELAEVASLWGERLTQATATYPADALYGGRSFRDSVVAANKAGARLLVVSAGLGLIDAGAQIPSYACTVLDGAQDSISARVLGGFSKAGWWRELSRVSPHAVGLPDVAGGSEGLILAALSDGYIEMMLAEFMALPEARQEDLRLFTRAPKERVPPQLHPFLMSYDDRLDGPDSPIRGTRSDFAARALLHFVDHVLMKGDQRSAAQHADAISLAMESWRAPPVFSRQRLTDEEITRLMHDHWAQVGGSAAKLLRLFRDELGIACEQGRFAALARQVREEVARG